MSYSSVASILKNNLESRKSRQTTGNDDPGPALDHANIRGAHYFH
jgi:hypothetical protein